jgi:GT2 family glycosyltransferase
MTSRPRHTRVSAILVSHDGARWLPRTLAAVDAQRRPIDRLVVVDTGSDDATTRILDEHLDEEYVQAPRDIGYGAALQFGIDQLDAYDPATGADEWLWLLHDDAAPATGALGYLLEAAGEDPAIGVVGPKVRSWYDRRTLLEVGVSISRSGRRETGLDKKEQDQGQRDGLSDPLAVGSAGMLVRRDVWHQLRGFDPRLPLFRDDVDFCWRTHLAGYRVVCTTDAVVYHAEAGARDRRALSATTDRPHQVDRRNALFLLLANMPARSLPYIVVRSIAGAMLRTLGFLLGKQGGYAVDEFLGLLGPLSRPDRIIAARRARARTRTVDPREIYPLLAPRGLSLRHAADAVWGLVSGSSEVSAAGRHAAAESGPGDEDTENLSSGSDVWRRVLTAPALLLTVALTILTLVAGRDLIGFGGRLSGGALLPAPAGASDLWTTYLQTWHPVSIGSDAVAPPYLAVVATVATLLFGKASLAVDVLLLGSVPLAGLLAYLALGRVVTSKVLRAWGAVAYASLPVLSGAIAGGRLGTAIAVVLLPVLAVLVAMALDPNRPRGWQPVFAGGFVLAVIAAFVPLAYVIAVILAVIAVATAWRTRGDAIRLASLLAVPPALLLPWTLAIVREPRLLLLEAGLPGPGLSDPRLPGYSVLLTDPGGPGPVPALVTAGLVLGALAALLRVTHRRLAVVAWAVVLTGCVVGVVVSRFNVTGPGVEGTVAVWPGLATAVVGLGLVLAATIAAGGARDRVTSMAFGWRQPLAVAVAVLAALSPVAAVAAWAWYGADDPLERREPQILPAYVAAEARTPDRPRTLLLRQDEEGRLAYAVLRGTAPRLGDAETGPEGTAFAALDELVADLVAGRAGQESTEIGSYAIRYVLVPAPTDVELARTLDAAPGLSRVSAPDGWTLWKIAGTTSRLRVISADGSVSSSLRSGVTGASATVEAGEPGRTLVLAEPASAGWQATLDGNPLERRTVDGWAQGFDLPPTGGTVELVHADDVRQRWLAVQAVLVGLVLVLMLPGRREEIGDETELDAGAATDDGSTPDDDRRRHAEVLPDLEEPTGKQPQPRQPVPAGAGFYPGEPTGTADPSAPDPDDTYERDPYRSVPSLGGHR